MVSGGGRGGGQHFVVRTAASSNVFFAQLMLRLGTANVLDMAQRLGIRSELLEVPSIKGAGEVSVLDMASVLSTFRDHGQHSRAGDHRAGRGLRRQRPLPGGPPARAGHQRQIADMVTTALRGVVTNGTGTSRPAIADPSYGKTGTAQNNKDAWFVGYTCDVSTAVWMGQAGGARPGGLLP